jgi:general secretion pathway protein L
MTILDAVPLDTRALLAQARRLLSAWGAELAGLIPRRLRLGSRPSLQAEPLSGGGFRFSRQGRELSWSPPRAGRPTPATLRLPRGTVLASEASAPDASESDIVRMLSLDVDRLTPFDAADVFTAISLAPTRAGAKGRRALVGVIPRTEALDLVARARSAGLAPRAVMAADSREGFPPLDFTEGMSPLLSPAGSGRTRLLWVLAALLAAIDLAAFVANDVASTRQLRAELAVLRPRLVVVQRLRSRVLAEEARRSEILAARKRTEPLRVLDEVSRYLPDGAWVERFNWNGQTIRLSGYRREGVDVAANLRQAPDFADVRNAASDVGGGAAAGIPFDVSIQVRQPLP